jgi:hypothetical protein
MFEDLSDMQDSPEILPEPANLRFLRRLVTALTFTMIIGLVAIFTIIVMQFSKTIDVSGISSIELPEGVTASTYTKGSDWYAIVTTTDQILIYNTSDQSLRQTIQIANE